MNNPNTVAGAIASATMRLNPHSDSPKLDAEVLLLHLLDKPRSYLFTWPDATLTDTQLNNFDAMLKRREQGEPVAHITQTREFWSLPFKVSPSTLIPRPDTETLVECALQFANNDARILDLGTGTGAIALALASELPNAKVVGVDRIEDAVLLAKENQAHLKLDAEFLQSDWFSALAGREFDVIVSNPPYIDENDPHLAEGDVRFEPRSALVANEQGLSDIRHICLHAKAYLANGGLLAFEHGYQQGEAVRNLLTEHGFINVATQTDLGGNDRVSYGFVAKE